MPKKRTSEESRKHLLAKIRKLESRIMNLSDSDKEEIEEMEEGEIMEMDSGSQLDENLYEGFLEEENKEQIIDEEQKEEILDEEVLDILGMAPTPTPKKETLHKDIAERWTNILVKGLKKEDKEGISMDNPPFENVSKMVAPKLNKEVMAALNENAKKRDLLIENRQKQISTALACIGQALQLSLGNIQEQKLKIIKKINEAGRLLCDSLYIDSRGRRKLVLSVINKDLKDFVSGTEPGEFLFGDDLAEKIKTAKAVQRSARDLKMSEEKKKNFINRAENKNKYNNQALNWRGSPQVGPSPQRKSQRSGGPAFNHFNRQQTGKRFEDRTASKRGRK